MDNLQNLLSLIDKGDPLVILSEEKLTEGLNELLKNDLITFDDGKVILTEKGREQCVNGIPSFLKAEPVDEEVEFSDVSCRQSRLIFLLSFLILLVTVVILSTMFLWE